MGSAFDIWQFGGTLVLINKNTGIKKSLGRLAIILIVSAIILLPYIFVPSDSNLVVVYIFKDSLPLFAVMFVIFGLSSAAFKKMQLVWLIINEQS